MNRPAAAVEGVSSGGAGITATIGVGTVLYRPGALDNYAQIQNTIS